MDANVAANAVPRGMGSKSKLTNPAIAVALRAEAYRGPR